MDQEAVGDRQHTKLAKFTGCLHDPANVQQTFSKCIQNTRADAGRLLDRVNTLLVKWQDCSTLSEQATAHTYGNQTIHKTQFDLLRENCCANNNAN